MFARWFHFFTRKVLHPSNTRPPRDLRENLAHQTQAGPPRSSRSSAEDLHHPRAALGAHLSHHPRPTADAGAAGALQAREYDDHVFEGGDLAGNGEG